MKSAATNLLTTSATDQESSFELTDRDVQQVRRGVLESDTESPEVSLKE